MFKNKKIHMIGIGGISMSGIAEMLLDFGAIVTGSDVTETKITEKLAGQGINILYGHHPEMIKDADIVVFTAAISKEDPERVEATNLNKTMFERAEFLGQISKLYKNCLCISGTHGKSSTTSMVSLAFLEAKMNPTIQVGALLPQIDGNSFIGSKDYLIMESCEYVDSFLHFHPTGTIITNIDNDHLDYFGNLDNIKKSFKKFVNLIPNDGFLVINNDDENSKNIYDETNALVITYGINNESNYMARNIVCNSKGYYSFDVYYNGEFLININLSVNGKHNIYNALATIALSKNYINDINDIKNGIESYHGIERRFEFIGKYKNVLIYDDYAHHPTEIKTTIDSVKSVKHNESWVVFQPHTYSRTKEHMEDFAKVLSEFDHVIIATIYAAREVNTFNINEDMLVDGIKKNGNNNVLYIDSFDKIVDYLKEFTHDTDLVITVGAGPVNKVGLLLKDQC
ncbi:MAG: UDP-N-acetylmuramate--L-alanine ligase [Bacilli bacterium]